MRQAAAVFIHGFNSGPDVWESFRHLLSQDSDISSEYDLRVFPYASSLANVHGRKRIPDIDTLALSLRTFLQVETKGYNRLAIVTHSQGGLIVQRYLEGMLADGKGNELARIRRIIMFACPNSGSDFKLQWRKLLGRAWRNPQEVELRPLAEGVAKAHRRV